MTSQDEPTAAEEPQPPRHRVRVPGLKEDVGLGDVIERATSAVGIKPCAPCKKRQAALNRWVGFGT